MDRFAPATVAVGALSHAERAGAGPRQDDEPLSADDRGAAVIFALTGLVFLGALVVVSPQPELAVVGLAGAGLLLVLLAWSRRA